MPPQPGTIQLVVAVSCQTSGGKLTFTATTSATPAGGAEARVSVRNAAGATVGNIYLTPDSASSHNWTGELTGLPNGTYRSVAYDDTAVSTERVSSVACSTSPGGGTVLTGTLSVVRVDTVDASPPRSATGQATPRARTANGSAIAAADVVQVHLGDFVWTNCTKNGAEAWHTFTGLAAGNYTAYMRLIPGGGNNPPSQQFRGAFRVNDVIVLGCIDPSADNYDPNANTPDPGNPCVYSPLVAKPSFTYPRLNPLRMIEPVTPDDITVFRNADNSLERQLLDPVRRDGGPYCQKWCAGDLLVLQFRTNYDTFNIRVVDARNNNVVADHINTIKRTNWRGQTRNYRGWLTPDFNPNGSRSTTRSRVYFIGGLLPTVFSGGDRIIVENAGVDFDARYAVQAIGYDSLSEIPYVLINFVWPSAYGPERVNATILSEYDALPVDVFEFAVPLGALPSGTYQVLLTASGSSAAFTVRDLISEPFSVAPSWPGTLHILYQNLNPYGGLNFSSGFFGMLRIEGDFSETEPGGTSLSYTNPDGSLTTLAATRVRRRRLEVFLLPAYLLDLLDAVIYCDELRINGLSCRVSDSGIDVRYPSKRWSLANGAVTMQLPEVDSAVNIDPPSGGAGGRILISNTGALLY